jgi:hypothetical protein
VAGLTLTDLANLGEFVGGIVVVVSLIYLAVQVQHNTASLRTENYARTLERISAMQSMLGGDPELTEVHARGIADATSIGPLDRIRLTWWLMEAFGAFEFMFHQARAGSLPEEVWERWEATIAWWLTHPGVQAWWSGKPTPFSKSFSEFVDRCIAERPYDASNAERWQSFVRTGSANAD